MIIRYSSESFTEWLVIAVLALPTYGFVFSHGSFSLLVGMLLGSALFILAILVVTHGTSFYTTAYNLFITLGFPAYLFLNILINQEHYYGNPSLGKSIAHVLGFGLYLFMLNWLVTNLDVQKVTAKLAWMIMPLVLIALGVSITSGALRANPFGLQPNWWGELTVAFSIAALAVSAIRVRLVMLVLAILLLFFVQSRSGMVGWAIVFSIEALRAWRQTSIGRRAGITVLVMTVLIVTISFTSLFYLVADKVFFLNNPYRGLGTGLTGRVQGWEIAMAAFARNPVFGNGIDTYAFVHSGFLQILSEGGAVLAAMVFIVWVVGLKHAFSTTNWLKLAALLAVPGYVAFQPRMLNLNLTSLMFWLAVYDWSYCEIVSKSGQQRVVSAAISPTGVHNG